MKIVAAVLCGIVIGIAALSAWLVWYFRDVMR